MPTFVDKLKNIFQTAKPTPSASAYSQELRSQNIQALLRAGGNRDEDSTVDAYDRHVYRSILHDLYRKDATLRSVVDRIATAVVGSGIYPQAKTSSQEWNKEGEAYFNNWSLICDARQRAVLVDIQKQMVIAKLLDGSFGMILTDSYQLQTIEAGRLLTPNNLRDANFISDGIKLNKNGIAVGYYVAKRGKDGRPDADLTEFVLAPYYIHCYEQKRPDMIHGQPDLAPVVETLTKLDRLSRATIQKANIEASNALAILSKQQASIQIKNLGDKNVTGEPNRNVAGNTQIEKTDIGTIWRLKPDEDVKFLEGKTPHETYATFRKELIRSICSAVGISYEFALLDFTASNGDRSGLLLTQKSIEGYQNWIARYMRRIWNWRIAAAIKNGELSPAPLDANGVSEWYKVEWQYPDFSWVLDPNRESVNNQINYAMGTTTIADIVHKQGQEVEDVLARKAKEISLAHRLAQEENKLNKGETALTWRDIIAPTTAGLVSTAQTQADQAAKGAGKE
jgi:lambda family phage portal protein